MEHILGYIAGTLTTICFIPQALKTIKTKDTQGISLLMYILFTIGVFCWLAYGIMLGSPPMIIFNIMTLVLSLLILFMKIKHG